MLYLIILILSVCLPLCWLAVKTPELLEYNLGPVNMGLALDIFKEKLEAAITDPGLVLRESFMMKSFKIPLRLTVNERILESHFKKR